MSHHSIHTLVKRWIQQLFKLDDYLMCENDYTQYFVALV